ncbi:cytochrome C5 [Comamonas piscis]|uniref:Cytochrome C5 n=1 Tax=Comamonas piscis TaxID=1562974 RepID=A0A7G5EK64_9BURK|nr:cytochrome C5 [Comamonas piscis]QMV74389.1 cytochrome C5 [Comamonas piscis]WSO32839.1 hypothetical protein VUJ63_17015 [Comamonas piscis]
MTQIAHLRDAIAASQLLQDVEAADGFVIGSVRFKAAGADIHVNVDPELDDHPEMDANALIANTQRFLAMPVERWQQLVNDIVLEVEDAVEEVEDDAEVQEPTDLRDDLRLHSVAVFADAVLLSFVAPQQFPQCWVRAQLCEELALEDISIDEDDSVETLEFKSLDDMLDNLSANNDK